MAKSIEVEHDYAIGYDTTKQARGERFRGYYFEQTGSSTEIIREIIKRRFMLLAVNLFLAVSVQKRAPLQEWWYQPKGDGGDDAQRPGGVDQE